MSLGTQIKEARTALGLTQEGLAEALGAAVVHTDDFVVPHAMKTKERLAIPGGNYPGTGEDTEKIVELGPGDSKTASLFAHSSIIRRHKKTITPAARLYIILNGLPKGEQVVFDSLELKPLCGKR